MSMKPVPLLVDLHNDFLRPGDLEPHPASVIAAAANLLNACRTGGEHGPANREFFTRVQSIYLA